MKSFYEIYQMVLTERDWSDDPVVSPGRSVHEIMMCYYNKGEQDAKNGSPADPKKATASCGIQEYEDWMGDAYMQGYKGT